MASNKEAKRIVVDYLDKDKNFDFKIGKVEHYSVSCPLEEHIHGDYFELTYCVKGTQTYWVEGKSYTMESGDVFITLPEEKHGSGECFKEKSQIYYLQLHRSLLGLLGLGENVDFFYTNLSNLKNRKFQVDKGTLILLEEILQEALYTTSFSKIILRNKLSELLVECIKGAKASKNEEKDIPNSIRKVLAYVEEHLEENIKIEDMLEGVSWSESRFKVVFRECMGVPPKEYVLRKKMEKARELIEEDKYSITDIAYKMGFSSSQYFTVVFKRFNMHTPTKYQSLYKKGLINKEKDQNN
nr:helix-turn-helix domain-containing protein [uncultured Niameybacter sp.]